MDNDLTTPSLAEQLDQIMGKDASDVITKEKTEEAVPTLEAEDLEGLVELPFDVAAITTGFDGFSLDEKETRKLSKLFMKPIARIAGKNPNLDIVLACSTLISIAAGKYVEYDLYLKNNSRNERARENQLDKGNV